MGWEKIQYIAFGLLLLRIVAVIFMTLVLRRQYKLFKEPVEPEAVHVRLVLFIFAVVIMVGQIVPIMIDLATILADVKRTTPNALGVAYGYSNATTAAISSILFWLIYRFIAQQNVRLAKKEKQNVELKKENDRLHE